MRSTASDFFLFVLQKERTRTCKTVEIGAIWQGIEVLRTASDSRHVGIVQGTKKIRLACTSGSLKTTEYVCALPMQADPGLAERDAGLLAEFEAAPWLLPPRTKALPYAGVHNLDALLQLRGSAAGSYPKTITLLTFNKRFSAITQNASECFRELAAWQIG